MPPTKLLARADDPGARFRVGPFPSRGPRTLGVPKTMDHASRQVGLRSDHGHWPVHDPRKYIPCYGGNHKSRGTPLNLSVSIWTLRFVRWTPHCRSLPDSLSLG